MKWPVFEVKFNRASKILILFLWMGAVSVAMASLLGSHLVALPKPPTHDARLSSSLQTLQAQALGSQKPWLGVHILMEGCGCSKRVFEHLLGRRAQLGIREKILYVGQEASVEAQAREAGFEFQYVTAEDLDGSFNVESSPLLLVTDPQGRVAYSGGYSQRKNIPPYIDEQIIASLREGKSLAGLPVFGCAVSKRLQKAIDPLGIKY